MFNFQRLKVPFIALELAQAVLADHIPHWEAGTVSHPTKCMLDALYCFQQKPDHESMVLSVGSHVWLDGRARVLLVSGESGREENRNIPSYSGGKRWLQLLSATGVPSLSVNDIRTPARGAIMVPLPGTSDESHTSREARALIQFAHDHGLSEVVITAAPFHQLRVYLAVVAAIDDLGYAIRVYNKPGLTSSWSEEVQYSQGKKTGERMRLLEIEWARILRGLDSGEMASIPRGISYMMERNRA